ncbi:Crp/Fnr family transcriptional regulator [Bradyrhizobium sp. ARR65]|uniref:Crp/Fnr family transcriptional regulator n=1 Tax=Bradyrhizobium sp. ARR65 TaxID=1040989 RepID=UPI0004645CDA|nr:Crp/Fnr family transcriptional regulator [Bradyrhizobium sp. ARR65]
MQTGFAYTKFADRLASIAELSASDLDLLAKMPFSIRHFASHENIWRKGDQPNCCCLLLQGYLCWKDADNVGGQITSIYVAGDVPDIQMLKWPRAEANLSTLGPAVVAFVPHAFFHEVASVSPSLSRALSLLSLADAASLRNWIINLGSRDSLTRVAYLICEIALRLRAVGQARDYRFPSPFTQSDLAAACGISAVHANRIIQELRRKRLLHWQSKMITIVDWRALVHLAGFNPDYLHLREPKPSELELLKPAAPEEAAASAPH